MNPARAWLGRIRAGLRLPALPPMPIVVGSPRSGTTLLRLMLDAHPQLAIPPETGFLVLGPSLERDASAENPESARERFFHAITGFPEDAPGWADFHIPAEHFRAALDELMPFSPAAGFRLFYRMYATRFGKPRWGDKTPGYCRHLQAILASLPEARFIHLIRDGRDVAVSLRPRFFSPGHAIETQARFWRDNVLAARTQGRACRNYLECHYEDLLREPETTLRKICTFIELDFHADMLRYHQRAPQRLAEHLQRRHVDGRVLITRQERLRQQLATTRPPDTSRIGTWRQALTPREQADFEATAGDLLRTLGYATTASRESQPEAADPDAIGLPGGTALGVERHG